MRQTRRLAILVLAGLVSSALYSVGISRISTAEAPESERAVAATRIFAGQTPQGFGWKVSGNGVYIDVDTSAAGFSKTPIYVTSIGGLKGHEELVGPSAVYKPTATSFRIYVMRRDGAKITLDMADYFQWYINWIGYES